MSLIAAAAAIIVESIHGIETLHPLPKPYTLLVLAGVLLVKEIPFRHVGHVAAKIGIELRNQYIIGYTPSNPERDGKYRRVQVKLVQPRGLPPLRAFWRLGYYAPTQ